MGKNEANIPKQTKSPLLFTGYIYCKECGSRLTLHYSYNHYKRKDGTVNRNKKAFYECSGKSSGKINCKSKMYSSNKIEDIVLKILYAYFETFEQIDIDKEILNKKEKKVKNHDKEIKLKKDNINKIEKDLKLLKSEIVNVLNGTSKFSEELLAEQIEEKNNELSRRKQELDRYKSITEREKLDKQELIELKNSIPKYREILESTDIETKKMILPKFIARIDVYGDDIKIKLNVKFKRLLDMIS